MNADPVIAALRKQQRLHDVQDIKTRKGSNANEGTQMDQRAGDNRIRKPIPLDLVRGVRMKRLRRSQGFATVAAFARYLDVHFTRWSNAEYGYPISRGLAARLRERVPGLTYEWIWHGDNDARLSAPSTPTKVQRLPNCGVGPFQSGRMAGAGSGAII